MLSSTDQPIAATSRMPSAEYSSDRKSPKSLSPASRSRSFHESPPVRRIAITSNSRSLSPKPKTSRNHDRRNTARKSSEIRIEESTAADRVFTQVVKESLSSESIHHFLSAAVPLLPQSRFEDVLPKSYDEARMGCPRRPQRRGSGSRFDAAPARDRSVESPRFPVRQASIVEPPAPQRRSSLSAAVERTPSPVKRCAPRTRSAFCSPSDLRRMESPVKTRATSEASAARQSPVKRSAPQAQSTLCSPEAIRGMESPVVSSAWQSPVKRSVPRTQSAFCSPTALKNMASSNETNTSPEPSPACRSPVKRSTPRTKSAIYSPGELSSPNILSARPTERRHSVDLLVKPTANEVNRTKTSPKLLDAIVDGVPTEQQMEDVNPKPAKSSLRRQTLLKRCTSTIGKSASRDKTEDRDSRQQKRMMKLYRKCSQEPSSTIKISTVPSIFPKRFSLTAVNISDAALFYSPSKKERPQETLSSPKPIQDRVMQAPFVGSPPSEGVSPQRRRHSLDYSIEVRSPNVLASPRKKSPPSNSLEIPMTTLGIDSVKSFGSNTTSTDVSEDCSILRETSPFNTYFQKPPTSGDSMSCLYHQSIRLQGDENTSSRNNERMSIKSSDLNDSILIGGNDSLCLYGKG